MRNAQNETRFSLKMITGTTGNPISFDSCNTEERIAQNIYIHNSNRNYKKINYNNNINQETDRHRL